MEKAKTRGFLNNNPLNIRLGDKWIGMVIPGRDKDFVEFRSVAFGLRAGIIILRTYFAKYGCNTIDTIIHRWSPPSENDTLTYVRYVTRVTGIDRYQRLAFADKGHLCRIVQAMCIMESDMVISLDLIAAVYDCVCNNNPGGCNSIPGISLIG